LPSHWRIPRMWEHMSVDPVQPCHRLAPRRGAVFRGFLRRNLGASTLHCVPSSATCTYSGARMARTGRYTQAGSLPIPRHAMPGRRGRNSCRGLSCVHASAIGVMPSASFGSPVRESRHPPPESRPGGRPRPDSRAWVPHTCRIHQSSSESLSYIPGVRCDTVKPASREKPPGDLVRG
jgi:hypothetical protein